MCGVSIKSPKKTAFAPVVTEIDGKTFAQLEVPKHISKENTSPSALCSGFRDLQSERRLPELTTAHIPSTQPPSIFPSPHPPVRMPVKYTLNRGAQCLLSSAPSVLS
ncbi:hypothetical protein EYF80_029048 [Liparis tanakae]|uniref:Uncharacterized protein n=1 Tax=Liparis tanakae TaxID=230148 RepID=A0A4Z2H7A2_9TELE|nr:hypothetical protein EYF80_029048 [Liparis tanakae]